MIPVNRVIEVYASLRIRESAIRRAGAAGVRPAGMRCMVVPTVTAFDPYNPPKFGAALQLFAQPGTFARSAAVDVRELVRSATPGPNESVPQRRGFVQVGRHVRCGQRIGAHAVFDYAEGRNDPLGPLGQKSIS